MWTRAALKEKAKRALSANYWRTIVVTLIVFLIGGASSGTGFSIDSDDMKSLFKTGSFSSIFGEDTTSDELDYNSGFFYDDVEDDIFEDNKFYEDFENYDNYDDLSKYNDMLFSVIIIVVLGIVVVGIIIGVALSVFLCNPLEVGTDRFFFKNLNQPAQISEVVFAFDNSYKNVIKIMFFRNLYLFGWSLLFLIPGIVKSYEYLLVPYLLAENPNLTKEDAFRLSKEMMMGHKWDTFVLGLSFIGWDILSGLTFGILSVFYVQPYKSLTFAALYEELSLINGRPATGFYQKNMMQNQMYGESENFVNEEI